MVEDDTSTRVLFAGLLEDEGYAVRQARDGIEALDLCAEALPDLMLLDINMPRLDGVALVQALEELGWREFPILVVSAAQERTAPISERVTSVTPKPVDLDRLVRQVSHLLVKQ